MDTLVPMSLLTNVPGIGFMHADAVELDRKLREGDGLVWKGDPDLWLGVGVATAPKRMQHPVTGKWLNRGDMVAKRYEVWRHTETGEDLLIGHWRIEEFDRILFDVAGMRASFEGRAPSTLDKIDAHNAELEKKASDEFRGYYGEMMTHLKRLVHDRTQPKNTFRQVGGSADDTGRNLSKD